MYDFDPDNPYYSNTELSLDDFRPVLGGDSLLDDPEFVTFDDEDYRELVDY